MISTRGYLSFWILGLVLFIQTEGSFAEVKLHSLFTDNMVLQQQCSVPDESIANAGRAERK